MINYGRVRGAEVPQNIEITSTAVYIASNIEPYTENIDDKTVTGYEYDYTQYSKDEYLLILSERNETLSDELQATKIILGVE